MELERPCGRRRATLASLFDAQVVRTPDAIALVSGDEQLTYAEFDARANRLARQLIPERVGPESTVGLCHPPKRRSSSHSTRSSRPAVPTSPSIPISPRTRSSTCFETAKPVCVVTPSRDNPRVRVDCAVLELDTLDLSGFDADTVTDDDRLAALHPELCLRDLHLGIDRQAQGRGGLARGGGQSRNVAAGYNPLTADDAVLQKTPFTFDASVREFWWAVAGRRAPGDRVAGGPS